MFWRWSATSFVSLWRLLLVSAELVSDSLDELDRRQLVHLLTTRTGQSLQVSATTLTVMADRARFAQVLVNLILNANKFSPPRSAIELDSGSRCRTWQSLSLTLSPETGRASASSSAAGS